MGQVRVKSGIPTEDRDTGIRPQDDLFGCVNGGWIRRTEIPDDRAMHGVLTQVHDAAEEHVRAIVEEAAAGNAPAGTAARKVGDLFASFMDADRADELGTTPITDELAEVRTVEDVSALLALAGRLHRTGVGDAIGLYVDTDARNSSRYLVHLNQSGLGLPDESYYREDSFAEMQAAYVAHLDPAGGISSGARGDSERDHPDARRGRTGVVPGARRAVGSSSDREGLDSVRDGGQVLRPDQQLHQGIRRRDRASALPRPALGRRRT